MKLFFNVFKSHIVEILTSSITLFESIALLLGLLKNDSNIGNYIPGDAIVIFLLYLFIVLFSLCVITNNIVSVCSEINCQKKRVFSEYDKKSIDDYLKNFISSGESIAILSHDMSWIDSDKNKDKRDLLLRKAANKELLLFVPAETDKVKELQRAGADVRYFGNLMSDPAYPLIKSRMTIINWNKPYPKLTYPIKKDGLHINYEIDCGEPANQLALDLIHLLIAQSSPCKREDYFDNQTKEKRNEPAVP